MCVDTIPVKSLDVMLLVFEEKEIEEPSGRYVFTGYFNGGKKSTEIKSRSRLLEIFVHLYVELTSIVLNAILPSYSVYDSWNLQISFADVTCVISTNAQPHLEPLTCFTST